MSLKDRVLASALIAGSTGSIGQSAPQKPYEPLPLTPVSRTQDACTVDGLPAVSNVDFLSLGQTVSAPQEVGNWLIPQVPLEALPLAERPFIPAEQTLFPIRESELKFSLDEMVSRLADGRHESNVLTAYPDPVTKLPLIGAGFSLRLPDKKLRPDLREPFAIEGKKHIEPEPLDLWLAAGLKKADFDAILDRFDRRMDEMHAGRMKAAAANRKFVHKIRGGDFGKDDISDDEARKLTRIAALQAGYNARFYAPEAFPLMTGSQQEGMAHIIYQWGPHAMELEHFIAALNHPGNVTGSGSLAPDFGRNVQQALSHDKGYSHKYNGRFKAVASMFDSAWQDDPHLAEANLKKLVHDKAGRSNHAEQLAGNHRHGPHAGRHGHGHHGASGDEAVMADARRPDEKGFREKIQERHQHHHHSKA